MGLFALCAMKKKIILVIISLLKLVIHVRSMSDDDVHLYFDLDSRDLRPIVGKGVLQFDPQDVKSNVGRGFIEEKQNKNKEISVLEKKKNIVKDDCGLNNECNKT